jgi:hypothetical protein
MTCHYSGTAWADVLYTSVRNTPGGVNDAARFLTERRNKTIHPETLRAKLRHIDGESISLEMVELLTEWMEEKAQGHRLDWLHSLNAQFGMTASVIGAAEREQDLQSTFNAKAASFGGLTTEIIAALADGRISFKEAESITKFAQDNQRASQAIIEVLRPILEARR